ncbi:hypothetical protein L2E82_45652 [Cichorium intybus]|uniref:Uncharacterized protein n=1 Tax=Cichorium intybus TaxID=13427 RepID=A0ACB8ZUG3_CICIN|nr:hypothetical protein L2E82_45652 [Cichorium intybus]
MESIEVSIDNKKFNIRVKELYSPQFVNPFSVEEQKDIGIQDGEENSEEEERDSEDDDSLDSDEDSSDFLSDEEVEMSLCDSNDRHPDLEKNDEIKPREEPMVSKKCAGEINEESKVILLNDEIKPREEPMVSEKCAAEINEESKVILLNEPTDVANNQENNESLKQTSPISTPPGPAISPQTSSGHFISPIGDSGENVRDTFKAEDGNGSNTELSANKNQEKGEPVDQIGLSDKMKLLLSRETPLKEKLERIAKKENTQNKCQSNSNKEIKSDRKIPIMERRITRSQSTRGRKTEIRQAWFEKETSSVESSFENVGITNRIDEIGSLCGFKEAKQDLSAKCHRSVGKKGVLIGKK